jgi:upstream activation factor subunit UAF30
MVKKTTAKKTTAKTATKKAATKKAAPKKATAKKAAPKKATAKKAAPKKATAKKAAPKKATAKKVAAPKKKTARKPNAAFMQALTPSEVLADVIGAAAVARTEVVKRLWAYIKKNNLQNPKNKRNILADEKLAKVFGKKEVSMFELASIIGKHLK